MSKKKKNRYSHNEKKAYFIGYGMGLISNDSNIPSCLDHNYGAGQNKKLISSASKGFFDGKKNKYSVPFEKGFNKYPVSLHAYLKANTKNK